MRKDQRLENHSQGGTRSVERTIVVLKAIAARKQIGWRLIDLAAHCGLPVTTAHRLMARLANERLIQQRSSDRRYIPGQLLYELSLAVPAYSGFQQTVRPYLESIAKAADGVAFLCLRSGDEVICIDRIGTSNVQPMTVVGTRRFLLGSTFGIAMLLKMPLSEQQSLLAANRRSFAKHKMPRAEAHEKMWRRSLRYGFGLSRSDVVMGLTGVGVAILDSRNMPFAALGLMGPSAEFDVPRIMRTATLLADESERIFAHTHELIDDISR